MADNKMRLMDYDEEVVRLAQEVFAAAGRGYTPEQLMDIRNIEDMMHKYWWCVDMQLWEMLEEVFTEDIVYLCNGFGGPISGRDQAARAAQSCPRGVIVPTHMGHNAVLQFTGPDTARLLVQLHDHHTVIADHALKDGWGLYVNDFVRCADGCWRIAVVRLGYRKVEGDKPIPEPKKRGL